ncbi:23S rRNA (guanosine(2251)-2'-O)-methyltransferase RlmB [Sansalvadorimonas verongulae]|uniref:23S rRNA (guanosine(2251)-2'-O)-methyltransferase RlmB n=1 Tax=Sansalvadorimonas verongulae TaxID=2172824 RepID=UPI0012BCD995|nr:23S rRNA (guanosine(2251)-2'-O)-methyltransferase RlmB [Sansalvadorimonas verongulae]MTI13863.1 23S rRNA (guanosine(2251)-2'-O)-methyltransferase RlmB [Sansalvadorimonas verongulae]
MTDNDISFGVHAVQALLESHPDQIMEIWFQKGRRGSRLEKLIEQARETGIPVKFVDRERIDRKADGVHQGVVALVRAAKVYRENDLYSLLDNLDQPPFLLILDSVTDPHNLGACMRSADAAGVQAVIVARDKSAPLNSIARKVACGAAENVPLITVTNLARTMRELQERGVWLIGAAGEASSNIYSTDLNGPMAIVMGAEGKGLRRLTREHCDALVHIPMVGSVSSLNVSVATGICLFEALRQRTQH